MNVFLYNKFRANRLDTIIFSTLILKSICLYDFLGKDNMASKHG